MTEAEASKASTKATTPTDDKSDTEAGDPDEATPADNAAAAPAEPSAPETETAAEPEEPVEPPAIQVPLARSGRSETRAAKQAAKQQEDENEALAPVSPIGRPTRPAWRPMEPAPSARGGVTVFGTRLTYPQAATGAGVLLVVLVLLIVLAVQAFGDDTPGIGPTGAPTAAGTNKPTASASAPQQAATTAPSGATSAPASSAPASSAPANIALPAGWKLYRQPASGSYPAFTIPIPNGAIISGGGSEMKFRWNNRLLIVARTGSPQADAYQDWLNQEANRRGTYGDYSQIKIVKVNYRDFESAADWEFTYTTNKGNAQHAVKRNIRVDDKSAYSLSWYTTPEDWAKAQSDLQLLYQDFQPK